MLRVTGYNASGAKVGRDQSDAPFTIEVVRLTAPSDPGISVTFGDTYDISWTRNVTVNPVEKVVLYYTKNATATPIIWKQIASFRVAKYPGTFPWEVPLLPVTETKCKVKVVLMDARGVIVGSDVSDSYFTIQP